MSEYLGRHIIVEDISDELPRQRRKSWHHRTSPVKSVTVHHVGGSTKLEGINAPIATAAFCSRRDDPNKPGLQGKNWPGIPYHLYVSFAPEVIDKRIVVYRCQPDEANTYHADIWNNESVAVAFQGTFASRHSRFGLAEPSHLQLEAWRELRGYLAERYELDAFEFWAHAWRGKPSCPGDALVQSISEWRRTHSLIETQDDLREVLAQVMDANIATAAEDPSGEVLKQWLRRFQFEQTIIDTRGEEKHALKQDGMFGPATESFIRRAMRERGML